MATAPQPTPQREKVTFEPNVPVMVTLKYAAGKEVSGRFGPQVMFSTADNRVMFVDLAVAQHINALEPQPGETIGICKRTRCQGSGAHWDVWLSPDTEKIRALKENSGLKLTAGGRNRSGASAVTPAPVSATPELPRSHTNNGNGSSSGLAEETNALVDAFASALRYAASKYSQMRPEDVRELLVTVYQRRANAKRIPEAPSR